MKYKAFINNWENSGSVENKTRGREPGGSPRAEGERMSADERKQHDCN